MNEFKVICSKCGSERVEETHEKEPNPPAGTIVILIKQKCLACGHEHVGRISALT